MILDQILEYKRREVALKETHQPLSSLERRISRVRPPRGFAAALQAPGISAIAEIKAKSPSKGVFRSQLDPCAIARSYEKNHARAISVLADREFFGGGPEVVAAVAEDPEVSIPVLYKDFIVSSYQIFEARAAAADAVLLIARAVDEAMLRRLVCLVRTLGMEALVETYDQGDVLCALRAKALVIGVNNRDLSTFTVDLAKSRALRSLIPAGIVTVSESGLKTPADIAAVATLGFDAILIGEALLTADEPGTELARLIHETPPVAANATVDAAPDGRFGPFGGRYAAESLMHNLEEFELGFLRYKEDPEFLRELADYLRHFVGRPTPLTPLRRLSAELGGARIYAKREDLNHTGAHKINNAIGQALLAKRLGKRRLIAETGAGQHGVAVATAASLLGLQCSIYMGAVDAERQSINVQRMQLLGADLRLVHSGSRTLKDAISEALREWTAHVEDAHYLLGSAVGPHPYPSVVRSFQEVIGVECRAQLLEAEGRLPDVVVACVGGGSNAIGTFTPFLHEPAVKLIGVQAAGQGLLTGHHAAPLVAGRTGILHGFKTYLLQDDDGQIRETQSIAPGLDYPGVGPQHAYLRDLGRVEYVAIDDRQAMAAFQRLCQSEGILPALESAHAVAHVLALAPQLAGDQILVVTISGRGDKDLTTAAAAMKKLAVDHA